ncbi:MAG: deoxyribodipyrimidine photo-lyase [Pirellulales bacterium]|nr:deoxyribodipyrimidine photo-lyase [Pirellulales bacterium]
MPAPTIVWFRLDLRLADNPALVAACEQGGPVVPVFIWAPEEEAPWQPGGASRWWLHHSLAALERELQARGSRLVIRRVDSSTGQSSLTILQELVADTGAAAVYWNRRYEKEIIERDSSIKSELRGVGREAESFNASLLFEPFEVANLQGKPFQVYTPFWKHCVARAAPPLATPAPNALPAPVDWPKSLPLKELNLLPRIPWDRQFYAAWQPGEQGATAQYNRFVENCLNEYKDARDFPGEATTSRLSPHLHFGEISPRSIWHEIWGMIREQGGAKTLFGAQAEHFLKELVWREFGYHLLYHFPHTDLRPLRPQYENFPWKDPQQAQTELRAWQRGQTGYPIIDAGMRQLWQIGWQHNRVRMITASFLVKDLLISWQEGAKWFWDTLVDADLASNTLGWQWTAGCGADAAPYFRIFNPITQGERFDAAGHYVRQYVPELAQLPDEWLHRPWEAPAGVLSTAGVTLGKTYPHPIVDHSAARTAALAALATISAEK